MTKTQIAKNAVRLVVQYGTGCIINAVIKNNLEPYDTNPAQDVAIFVSGVAIGGAVADAAGAYTDQYIDEIIGFSSSVKNSRK